ncbi:putative anucleate primary sterigmata (ApsB) [Aspergillus affinis]|uniref:putative anucleate primary sterigmata (ApsB) n=1 Tax=Aspergillus affinis TaxID=1070780 RepID=UPI0022FE0E22|nr:Anucleate primary sterigmata protein B [Aspergillus affinis]KAI9040486.1 Anucleate primary sterigmata protein B [Aspergillus affinis]
MSTGSARPPLPSSPPTKTLDAIEDAPPLRTLSPRWLPDPFDVEDEYSPVQDKFDGATDLMVQEDAPSDPPQDIMDTIGAQTTREEAASDEKQNESTTGPSEGQSVHDDTNASFNLPPLPDHDDSSLLPLSSEEGDHERVDDQTMMEEREMRRKLMDMESSFLPEPSTIEVAAPNPSAGADDTYLVGVPVENAPEPTKLDNIELSLVAPDEEFSRDMAWPNDGVSIPHTPNLRPEDDNTVDLETTPAASSDRQGDNTTMLEMIPSSPAAEAAARTVNRNQSIVSEDTRENSQTSLDESTEMSSVPNLDQALQPQDHNTRATSRSMSPTQAKTSQNSNGNDTEAASRTNSQRGDRPKYLTNRHSAHRLSYSSAASYNTEMTASDATLGADYALQSGGAVPTNPSGQSGQRNNLARSVSLGSMASGISGYSDENFLDKRNPNSITEGGLHTLDEEDPQSRPGSSYPQQHKQQPYFHGYQEQYSQSPQPPAEDTSDPITPRAKHHDDSFPTDTALAERVKDVQVPSTFVRQFREDYGGRGLSPDKRAGATPAFAKSGRTMTLKEQSSTIDRLSKENFDLKMRIHFLNEALNRRSEEGIKEMISENVELKSDKLKLQKDNQQLKRKMRDLEKQLNDQQSDKESMVNHDPEGSDEEDRDPAQDGEMLYLRERVETYELEIERLRSESIARESEKRRLAEMVKSLSDGRPMGSDVGAREERDMWKDMLEAETAAREQAEDENKRLRDEALRLRSEMTLAMVPARSGQRDRVASTASYSAPSDRDFRHTVTGSSSSSTLVVELELLKQENAELRKEVSAQTSMLTSRNKEKERLYQEIEEMKLGQRRDGGRSVTGDSIFDRSASRAHGRSSSRASDRTGPSPDDDAEREDLEARNGQLRDQLSGLKIENQNLRSELDETRRNIQTLEQEYGEEMDQAEEIISATEQERDEFLQERNEVIQERDQIIEEHNNLNELLRAREVEFENLRSEYQQEVEFLCSDLDQKSGECEQLEEALHKQEENLATLQAEMRSAGEGIIRLEEDAQNNLHRYKAVQQELEHCNQEMESLEKSLYEANTKVQRLTVQIESSQNEIAFLREEQDGDKIKIGDLESDLKTYGMSLQSEKEKTRELEERLAEERHQREVVGSKEKQEVQRIVNELNREAFAAKEEARRLKKSLSVQEIETTTWRDRLMDLENNLRETLGDLTGSRSSLISSITKLQKEFESTALELESVRSKLDETESLLRNRDALLESHALETKKLSEILDHERVARRADKQSFEQSLKSHQQASRTITQSNSRISELESARNQDRKRFTNLEQQFRDQLSERNAMLLTIWKRLSAMCGPDWAHSNSLINGNLPSQEVIGNILFWPGFSRNMMLAVKTVETVISSFKSRIKGVERELAKQYQVLEHACSVRFKRVERMEESMMNMRAQRYSQSQTGMSPELARLRGENRLLKAELNLRQPHSRIRVPTSAAAVAAGMASPSPRSPTRNRSVESDAEAPSSLVRHNSTVENPSQPHASRGLARSSTSGIPQPSHLSSTTTLAEGAGAMVHGSRSRPTQNDPGNEKWMRRLHELEKRLKAEREARLADRSGARQRLEERDAENERLRAQLERQYAQKAIAAGPSADDTRGHKLGRTQASDENYAGHRDDEPSSSEGEGIYVDIEV